MTLPTEKRKPISDLSNLITLVYGVPGIGKSTFASCFPETLFASTEPGLNNLEVFEYPIKSWLDWILLLTELEKEPTRYKTVCVDTVDNLYGFCAAFVLRDEGVKHESDLPYGKGFALVNKEFKLQLNRFCQMKTIGNIFVSHSIEREVRKPNSEFSETKITYTLPNGGQKVLSGMVDLILYMDVDNEGNRQIHTTPSADIVAKDRTGRLPAILPLDYGKFVKAFYKGGGGKEELISAIEKGLIYLAKNQIDGFHTRNRVDNSWEKHFGTKDWEEIKKADMSVLQEYRQHLRAKALTEERTK